MATVKNDIILRSLYDGKGAKAALADLAKLKAAMGAGGGGNALAASSRAVTQAAQGQAAALNTTATAAAKADAALLRMAQAQARLAGAQGNARAAADAYSAVLPKLTSGSIQSIQAQTGLERAMNAVARSSREAGSGAAVLPRTFAGLSHEAAAAAKGLLGVGAAIGALKGGYDLATMAANAEAARGSFDRMAESAGTSGKALLASLKDASAGTVAQTQLIQSANTALLLLGGDVATKLPQLLEVARASAQALGQDVGFVFDSLVTGISRGSTELIDNAGITLSATEAYATYAASIGKTVDQLTKAERSQAVLNGVLTAGQGIIAQSGTATETAAVKMQRAVAAFEDLKVAAGAALLPIAGQVAEATTAMITFGDTSAMVSQKILTGASSFDEYRAKLDAIPDPLAKLFGLYTQLSRAQFAAARAMVAHGASAEEAIAAVSNLAAFEVQLTGATQAQRDAFVDLAPAISRVAALGESGNAAAVGLMEAFMNGSISAEQFAAALDTVTRNHEAAHPAVVDHAAGYGAYEQAVLQGAAATRGMGEAAALTAEELAALAAEMQRIYQEGGQALGAYVQTELGFYAELADGAAAYNEEIAGLTAERAKATTDAERKAVDEQIAAVREGYAAQTAAQAEAYVQQQAAQSAHLGKMLQEYVVTQATMGNISKEQAALITEQIGQQFGLMEDQSAASFLRMAGQIDEFVASGNGDLTSLGTNLVAERDKAVELQGKMDALAKQYTAEVLTQMKGRAPEDIAAALRAIPARVYSEVVVTERRVNSGGTTRGNNTGGRAGGEVEDASGGQNLRGQSLSGKAGGKSSNSTSGLIATLADALEIIVWLSDTARKNEWNRANDLPNFITRLTLAVDSVQAIIDLAAITRKPVGAIDPKAIQAMVTDMVNAVTILGSQATPALNGLAKRISVMANAAQLTAELLGTMAEFRNSVMGANGKLAAPIPANYIRDMINEAAFAVAELSKAFARDTYGDDFRRNLGEWTNNAESAINLINGAADLSRNLQEPVPPIPPGVLERLADMTQQAVRVVSERLVPLTEEEHEQITVWSETANAAIGLLASAASLDVEAKDVDGTVLWSTLNNLADTTRDALAVIQARLLPLTDEAVAELQRWTQSAGAAIDAISSAAGLANDMKGLTGDGTVPLSVLQRLANLSRDALAIVQGVMLPTTEEQAAALERWASASGAAIDTLASVISLYGDVKGLTANGLSIDMLIQFAEDARAAVMVAEATLIPYTEEQAALLTRWGDVTGASIGALQAALELRNALADSAGSAPPTDAMLLRLADDGRRALAAIETRILPVTEEMNEAFSNYAGAVESATSGLSAAFSLSGEMFADYTSPTDAQLNLIATDAQRVARAFAAAAQTFGGPALEAATALGDALSSVYGAAIEGLTFNAALASGDFRLDTARFDEFVTGARYTLGGLAALAADAATIPAGNIAALNSASAALTGYGDAMIKMNAVPLNVPSLGGMGGGGTAINITNYITAQPGQDTNAIARLASDMTITKLQQSMRGNR